MVFNKNEIILLILMLILLILMLLFLILMLLFLIFMVFGFLTDYYMRETSLSKIIEDGNIIQVQTYFRRFEKKTTFEQTKFLDIVDGARIDLLGNINDIYEEENGDLVLKFVGGLPDGNEIEVFLDESVKDNIQDFSKGSNILVSGLIKSDKESNRILLVNADIGKARITNLKVLKAILW